MTEHITAQHGLKLGISLTGFLPKSWITAPAPRNPQVPVGEHLTYFNRVIGPLELLDDGTDTSHSPGGSWVRRMWAGGSLRLKPHQYFDKKRGFVLNSTIVGVEYIKDVRLRGDGDTAKIFVDIERRFAKVDELLENYSAAHSIKKASFVHAQRYFKDQAQGNEDWGDAFFKEERTLVFFKERTAGELDSFKAGDTVAVKYLDRQ